MTRAQLRASVRLLAATRTLTAKRRELSDARGTFNLALAEWQVVMGRRKAAS